MIPEFDDFVTWMYVLIDDIWQQIGHLYQRPGPPPDCSDSELLPMAIVGECREWDTETTLLGAWRTHPHLFAILPERSRFNRRRRNLAGAINHFELTSANADERDAARDLLIDKRDLSVIGDKGFISEALATELRQQANVRVLTLKRRNQRDREAPEVRRIINQVHQIIETVNGQLTEQFGMETNHAHSFWGLCARLYTKLTAHTLCIYLNRLLGNPEWLRIKALAFPT